MWEHFLKFLFSTMPFILSKQNTTTQTTDNKRKTGLKRGYFNFKGPGMLLLLFFFLIIIIIFFSFLAWCEVIKKKIYVMVVKFIW